MPNPGHDAVGHDSGTGQFTSGGGGGHSSLLRRREERERAQAGEEREGDRADSAYRRVQAVKRRQARERVDRAIKAARSDPKAAKKWEADVARARQQLGGLSSSQRKRLGDLERAAANGPPDYRKQKAAELAEYRRKLGI